MSLSKSDLHELRIASVATMLNVPGYMVRGLLEQRDELLEALEQALEELTLAWDERRLPHDCLSGESFRKMRDAMLRARGES